MPPPTNPPAYLLHNPVSPPPAAASHRPDHSDPSSPAHPYRATPPRPTAYPPLSPDPPWPPNAQSPHQRPAALHRLPVPHRPADWSRANPRAPPAVPPAASHWPYRAPANPPAPTARRKKPALPRNSRPVATPRPGHFPAPCPAPSPSPFHQDTAPLHAAHRTTPSPARPPQPANPAPTESAPTAPARHKWATTTVHDCRSRANWHRPCSPHNAPPLHPQHRPVPTPPGKIPSPAQRSTASLPSPPSSPALPLTVLFRRHPGLPATQTQPLPHPIHGPAHAVSYHLHTRQLIYPIQSLQPRQMPPQYP